MDTRRSFREQSSPPTASSNGHKSSGITTAPHLHYYSQRDGDRETTRYLSAATQISAEYARKVVSRVIYEPYRALAPSYGADVTVVARWALDSLRRLAVRDGMLATTLLVSILLCWLLSSFFSFPLVLLAVGAAALIYAYAIVVREYWIRNQILQRKMLRDNFDPAIAPIVSKARIKRRIEAVEERRSGNLVVFREHDAFAGSGKKIGREQLVIDVSRGKEDEDGNETEPIPFTNAEVHAAILKAVDAIKLRDMYVGERVFVNGKHVPGNQGLQRHPLEPPFAEVGEDVVRGAADHPAPDARAYVCAEIHGWQGQLIVTMFARAVHTGGWLYIEYSFFSLAPISWEYMAVDLLYEDTWARSLRKALWWGIHWTLPTFILSPVALAGQAVERLSWRAQEASQAHCIRRGQVFDYGAMPSIREDASARGRQHYFLARDEAMYLLLMQKSLLRELGKFLADHNVAPEEFENQAKIIIDASYNNYSQHIGSVTDSTFAFGKNAKASNEKKTGGGP